GRRHVDAEHEAPPGPRERHERIGRRLGRTAPASLRLDADSELAARRCARRAPGGAQLERGAGRDRDYEAAGARAGPRSRRERQPERDAMPAGHLSPPRRPPYLVSRRAAMCADASHPALRETRGPMSDPESPARAAIRAEYERRLALRRAGAEAAQRL